MKGVKILSLLFVGLFLLNVSFSVLATGGDITYYIDGADNYTIHTFTSDDDFIISEGGDIEILVVGGGGGSSNYISGGGAGGDINYSSSLSVTTGTVAVVIGAGGVGLTGTAAGNRGGTGGTTTFTGYLTALGGEGATGVNPGVGGIGENGAGSGGDAGENGEDGTTYDISGSSVKYSAGGGGCDNGGGIGLGGDDGGGDGCSGDNCQSESGTANSGSGAGGNRYNPPLASNGGSGIVIIKYLPYSNPNFNATAVFDNSTSYFTEFNNSLNLNFEAYNISGYEVPQLLNLVINDLGINQNFTAGENVSITFNNVSISNYTINVFNPFNESVNLTSYVITPRYSTDFFDNSLTHFTKFNTTQNINITSSNNYNLPINQLLTLNINDLGINQNFTAGENVSITFNNVSIWNYTINVFNPFNTSFSENYYFYISNANLTNSFNNMTNGFSSLINITLNDISTSIPYTSNVYLLWNNSYQTVIGSNPYQSTISAVDITPLWNVSVNIQSIVSTTYLGTTINTTQNDTQYIYRLGIDNCSLYSTPFIIFVGKDETTNINENIDLSINFEFNSEILYNNSFFNQPNYTFCYSPGFNTYSIDSEISFKGSNTSLYTVSRDYFLNNFDINDELNTVNLYVLENSKSTLLEFEVIDSVGIGLSDYFVLFKRWDLGSNSYSEVTKTTTDATGGGSVYVEFNDVWYQVVIINEDGEVIKTFSKQKFTTSPVSFPVTDSLGTEYIYRTECFSSNVYQSGETIVAEVTDTCGLNTAVNLTVSKAGILQNYITCDKGLTGSGSLTTYCDINTTDNRYYVYVTALIDDDTILIFSDYFDFTTIEENTKGGFGLIGSFLLIGTLGIMGLLINGSIGGLLSIIGLLISYAFGLITIPWSAMMGIIGIFIVIMLVVKK